LRRRDEESGEQRGNGDNLPSEQVKAACV